MSEIPHDHLKVECWPPRPKGGQHVGSGPIGVKITHIPSGVEAVVDIHRSQHTNKLIAMDMILAAITHPRMPDGMSFDLRVSDGNPPGEDASAAEGQSPASAVPEGQTPSLTSPLALEGRE